MLQPPWVSPTISLLQWWNVIVIDFFGPFEPVHAAVLGLTRHTMTNITHTTAYSTLYPPVCGHINHFGSHIKEIRLWKAWGLLCWKGLGRTLTCVHVHQPLQGHVTITWDNPEELEEYISRLQSAADRLTSENRRLRKCHGTLIDKVP